MIEALGHAPAFRSWLPVELLFRETAKRSSRIDGDCVRLANETIYLFGYLFGGLGVHKDLISQRHAVFAGIGGAHQCLTYRIDHDRLPATHRRTQHARRFSAHMA